MKLKVKLYGTLSHDFDAYDHQNGVDVTIPEGTTIHDLLVHLNLAPNGIGMIFMNSRPVKKNARIKDEAKIKIFQPIFGG